MSLSEAFEDRYYRAGYVYIAGSLSGRLMKFGVTINIGPQQRRLRGDEYGSIDDWVMLHHVWVDKDSAKIEHAALKRLRRYQTLRMYKKNGWPQKAREIVRCSFSTAQGALSELLSDEQRSSAWSSRYCSDYEF